MFERLINAPQIHKVPSNTLAVQRRMRKNICDLTRDFYYNIVEIEDHKQCSAQKIGQKLAYLPIPRRFRYGTNLTFNQLKNCAGNGREIPGVLPHIFFWTHKGSQTMSQVGLSRVNNNESEMAVKLTMYLVCCGVPKASIAILTPYKGQLLLIRNQMIRNKLFKKFDPSDSVRLSTVDRFQGDEADIVIISLVIDAKSHTPFVKLCNRMIVLLSRARLGMYILGNIGYFEEKPDASIEHWLKTITKLRRTSDPDTDQSIMKEDVDSLHFHGPRLGDELPICCPIHRDKTINAKTPADLRLNFCDIKCTVELSCSHPCDLNCHFQSMDIHNSTCMKKIQPPPCHKHNADLTCADIYRNIALSSYMHRVVPIERALEMYRCPVKADVQLPCQHIVQMSCAEETDIADRKTEYPECKELAHNPYVYPSCSHELRVLCCVWYEYKKHPSRVKPCKEKVLYVL